MKDSIEALQDDVVARFNRDMDTEAELQRQSQGLRPGDEVLFRSVQGYTFKGRWVRRKDDYSDIILTYSGHEVRADRDTIMKVEPEVEIMDEAWKIPAALVLLAAFFWFGLWLFGKLFIR